MTIKRMSNHANITTVRGERKHIKSIFAVSGRLRDDICS